MKLNDATTGRLWTIAEPVCTGAGYELVDLALTQSPGGWVLRVYIDHLPEEEPEPGQGSGISFDDCERVSRELGAVLDVEDPIEHSYSLEVSSPGLDRPLRTADHFERYLGEEVKVTLGAGLGGRRNFKGTVVSVERAPETSETIITINVDGTEYRLPFSDIESARLVPDWDALFPRGQQR